MDLDGDGNRDILSGSYSRMESSMAGLFQVLWGQAGGGFKKAEPLKGADGEPLIIPADEDNQIENICTRPFAVDWNGDGHLDLVVGNFAGTFYVFQGEGKGRFEPKCRQIMAGEEPLKIEGYHSDPFVIDWDGDGDLDLLSGSSSGGVQWAENLAGAGKTPQFKAFAALIESGPPIQYGQAVVESELKGPASSTRIWVDDVNGDGKLDLLVGDTVAVSTAAGNLTEEERKAKLAAWEKDLEQAVQALNGPFTDDKQREEAAQRFKELAGQRDQFQTGSSQTGFVWLYVQR